MNTVRDSVLGSLESDLKVLQKGTGDDVQRGQCYNQFRSFKILYTS